MGGFQEGGFQIVERAVFSSRKSVIAGEFLLKIDTLLAIATSGLRTNLQPKILVDLNDDTLNAIAVRSRVRHVQTCTQRIQSKKRLIGIATSLLSPLLILQQFWCLAHLQLACRALWLGQG